MQIDWVPSVDVIPHYGSARRCLANCFKDCYFSSKFLGDLVELELPDGDASPKSVDMEILLHFVWLAGSSHWHCI